MIRHIVTWKLSAEEDSAKDLAFAAISAALTPLAQTIPEIVSLRVARNMAYPDANWDVVLMGDFASVEDLTAYQRHPDHVRAGAVVRQHVAQRASVDFEL
jgi:hypothetical protein